LKKCRNRQIETAGDSFEKVGPREWKSHKEEEEEEDKSVVVKLIALQILHYFLTYSPHQKNVSNKILRA
jgi:hypothetical protein